MAKAGYFSQMESRSAQMFQLNFVNSCLRIFIEKLCYRPQFAGKYDALPQKPRRDKSGYAFWKDLMAILILNGC